MPRPLLFQPNLDPEPGWTDLDPRSLIGSRRSFVSSDPEGERLRVRYFLEPSDGPLRAKAWFGPGAEGPPGHAHGGSMAALLDEAMGVACWAAGHPVLAARLTVHFRRPLPLGSSVLVTTELRMVRGNKVYTRGRLLGPRGTLYTEAEGLFVRIDPARVAEVLGAGKEAGG